MFQKKYSSQHVFHKFKKKMFLKSFSL